MNADLMRAMALAQRRYEARERSIRLPCTFSKALIDDINACSSEPKS